MRADQASGHKVITFALARLTRSPLTAPRLAGLDGLLLVGTHLVN